MKVKVVVIAVLMLVMWCSVAIAGEVLNPTFQQAKSMALSAGCNESGAYAKIIRVGKETYVVAFIPSTEVIGVVVFHEDGSATEVHVKNGKYERCEIFPPFFTTEEISEKDAVGYVKDVMSKFLSNV